MIVAKLNIKKIPDRCSKCRCRYFDGEVWFCATTGKLLELTYNKEKNNWEYAKPQWCPLVEIKED